MQGMVLVFVQIQITKESSSTLKPEDWKNNELELNVLVRHSPQSWDAPLLPKERAKASTRPQRFPSDPIRSQFATPGPTAAPPC